MDQLRRGKRMILEGFILLFFCMAGFCQAENPDFAVAILQEDFPEQPSYANPLELKTYLESQQIPAQFLSAEDLADDQKMQPEKIGAVILPYGACFPLAARETFLRYLKSGGSFIAMGGYAFDDLMEKKNGKWAKVETDDSNLLLSGRSGKPGDWIRFQEDQIVLFDPTFPFKRVESLKRAGGSLGMRDWEIPLVIEGFPATALSGNNSPVFGKPDARWYSLVEAYDRYDRPRGSVFALLFHYDGPFRGSAWAFSGVTNLNLFSTPYPAMLESLAKTIRAIQTRVFLADLSVSSGADASHRTIVTRVANFGRNPVDIDLENTLTLKLGTQKLTLSPGELKNVEEEVNIQPFESFRSFQVRLNASGMFYDALDQAILKPGGSSEAKMSFQWMNNYLTVDEKPAFLFGTNQTGIVWYSSNEHPMTWERDFDRMRDMGLRVLRVLHFSPFAVKGFDGQLEHTALDLAQQPPERLVRETDELAAQCARHGLALILTLHDWLPVELTEEELDAQRQWCRFWAQHFRGQKHVLFDIQNEPSVEPRHSEFVTQLWNDFLKEKYQDEEHLREAWGKFAGDEAWGQIPCEPGPDEWENLRRVDFNRFRSWLVQRWIGANERGIREGNPEALSTVGFLQNEWQADKWLPADELTFSNTHYHGPVEGFSPVFKLTDRRYRGQGLSVGEYGAWDAHEARTHGRFEDKTTASIHHFLAVGHEALGMGGAFALNWDLKDLPECVFPWGLFTTQENIPKDWTCALKNMSQFFSAFQPKYETPEVFFLIPDQHRLGAKTATMHEALHNAMNLMFACHINFGVINEESLDQLPADTKVLIWPIPYCPSDEVFGKVLDFVKNGGALYFSGEIGFDENRKPTRIGRYADLGFPKREPLPPWVADIPDEQLPLIPSKVGLGRVDYLPVAVEFNSPDRFSWNPYKEFLRWVDDKSVNVVPDDPKLHVFSISEENGNRIYTLFRCEPDSSNRSYRLTLDGHHAQLDLGGMETGLLEIDPSGNLLSIEGTGKMSWDGVPLIHTSAHVMVQSRDRESITKSANLWILPTRAGDFSLMSESMQVPGLSVGDWNDGRWVEYQAMQLQSDSQEIHFVIDGDMAVSMMRLTDKKKTK